MSKKHSQRRPAIERRKREKAARKLAIERDRLAALERGGSAARPLDVASASVLEPRATSTPCHQCGGELALTDHAAESGLRKLALQCKLCHAPRILWFRIAHPLPS